MPSDDEEERHNDTSKNHIQALCHKCRNLHNYVLCKKNFKNFTVISTYIFTGTPGAKQIQILLLH